MDFEKIITSESFFSKIVLFLESFVLWEEYVLKKFIFSKYLKKS
jgi:hypothetical protein